MINNLNKKGSVDTFFTWIGAFLIIVFIMILFNVAMLLIFTDNDLFSEPNVKFFGSNVDLILNSKFLDFLNTRIIIDGRGEKIIDVLKTSLDPYFDIKNGRGESFIELFGSESLTPKNSELKSVYRDRLRGEMINLGFTGNQFDEVIDIGTNLRFSERYGAIIKELDKFCKVESLDTYVFQLPYGYIIKERLKFNYKPNQESRLAFNKKIIHKTNYRGENMQISFGIYGECK